MGISKISKIGFGIYGVAFIIMIGLVVLSKTIGDMIWYMLSGGVMLVVVGAFISRRNNNYKD